MINDVKSKYQSLISGMYLSEKKNTTHKEKVLNFYAMLNTLESLKEQERAYRLRQMICLIYFGSYEAVTKLFFFLFFFQTKNMNDTNSL